MSTSHLKPSNRVQRLLGLYTGGVFTTAAFIVFAVFYAAALFGLDWIALLARDRYAEIIWQWELIPWLVLFASGAALVFAGRRYRACSKQAVSALLGAALVVTATGNVWRADPVEWLGRFMIVRGASLLDNMVFKTDYQYRPYFTYLFMAKHLKGKEIVLFENDFLVDHLLEAVGEVRVIKGIDYRHQLSDARRLALLAHDHLHFLNKSARGLMIGFYFIEPYEKYGHGRYYLMTYEGRESPPNPAERLEYPTQSTRYFLVPASLLPAE